MLTYGRETPSSRANCPVFSPAFRLAALTFAGSSFMPEKK
jgi:hypothetical protein